MYNLIVVTAAVMSATSYKLDTVTDLGCS